MKQGEKIVQRSRAPRISRRTLLGAGALLGFPSIWIPRPVYAQQCAARGGIKHLIYIRLSGGFRFTAAFNGAVGEQFNPFGVATDAAAGTEWGPSRLVSLAPWLEGTNGAATAALGLRPVTAFTNEMMLFGTVDHEPAAGNADGNHGTGLERYLTGYVGGENSLFTFLHYGMRERIAAAAREGRVELPPFVLGSTGMALGNGELAAYRPPVVQSESLDGFAVGTGRALPAWAVRMAEATDGRFQAAVRPASRPMIESYRGARESTKQFGEIFASDILRSNVRNEQPVDGATNQALTALLGDSFTGRQLRLALRLFHFGCPAVYLDQGGYDLHSDEDERLPERMGELNRLLSGLNVALKQMTHPSGGTYWDHTLVVMGSEFGRTTRGGSFNSAGGSDHGGDLATRWMSMPMMGGIVTQLGLGGRQFGRTSASDLRATEQVYSYRSVFKTLMDLLCADHSTVFSGDRVLSEVFG
jgi:hypothetical protein